MKKIMNYVQLFDFKKEIFDKNLKRYVFIARCLVLFIFNLFF